MIQTTCSNPTEGANRLMNDIPTEKTPQEARQGQRGRPVLLVLVVSAAIAALGLAVVGLIYSVGG